jgi:hypothetical protein
MQPVSSQRIDKHIPAETNVNTELLLETVFSTRSVQSGYKKDMLVEICKLGMICSVKPVLTEDLCVEQKK